MNKDDAVYSLDDVVKKWAWDRFASHLHCPKIVLKRLYKLQVSWSNVTTAQGDIQYDPPEKDNKEAMLSSQSGTKKDDEATPLSPSETAHNDEATTSPRSETEKNLLSQTQRSATHETLVTTFANRSDQPQQHTLQVQQVVRSTCKVVMTKGVTHGKTCSFNLKVPNDIVGAGASYQYQRVVTDSKEQTFEHEVTWSGHCQVTVSPYTYSEAKTVSTTRWVVRKFSLDKFFSGIVSVRIKPRIGKPLRCVQQGAIEDIVRDDKKSRINGSIDGNKYKTTIQGECSFQYFMEHKIEVSHKALAKPNDTPLESSDEKETVLQKPLTKPDTDSQVKYVNARFNTL